MGTEARNKPASESAAVGLPVAARSARSAGVKLTSGANNASMIRPSRTLRSSTVSLTFREAGLRGKPLEVSGYTQPERRSTPRRGLGLQSNRFAS